MKILHVVVGLDPALGGPPAVALRLASAQARLAHDVTICGMERPEQRAAILTSMQAVPGIEHVRYQPLEPKVHAGWFVSLRAAAVLRDVIQSADVVHLHGLWEPLIRTAATIASELHRPYMLTPHGMLDPWSLQQRRLKKMIALQLVFRRILNRASCLHILNEDEAALLRPLGLRSPMEVIPNGVFLEEMEPLPAIGSFRAKHPELHDDPFVLFLSRLHFKKGLDYLADAFALVSAQLPNVRLVVAGPDEGAQSEFEHRIRNTGLSDRVHIVGPIWSRDKYAAMVDAACFCLPSRQEGFSMAITEALACGLPVVISQDCHFPEVADQRAGEVTSLNAEEIAAALLRVLASNAERNAMGRRGRELVLSRFTWPAIAERTINVYRRLVNQQPASA